MGFTRRKSPSVGYAIITKPMQTVVHTQYKVLCHLN